MAEVTLRVRIITPNENTEFEEGQTIAARGALNAPAGFFIVPGTGRVTVSFGATQETATVLDNGAWECSGTIPVPPSTPNGTPFPIAVNASATIKNVPPPTTPSLISLTVARRLSSS